MAKTKRTTTVDHTFALTRWHWINFLAGVVVGVWIWHPFWGFVVSMAQTLSGMIDKK